VNQKRLAAIADRYGAEHGFPPDVAQLYLGSILKYAIGPRELEAIERFSEAADALACCPVAGRCVCIPCEPPPQTALRCPRCVNCRRTCATRRNSAASNRSTASSNCTMN